MMSRKRRAAAQEAAVQAARAAQAAEQAAWQADYQERVRAARRASQDRVDALGFPRTGRGSQVELADALDAAHRITTA